MPTTFQVNLHPSESYKLDKEHIRITSGPAVLLTEQLAQLRGSTEHIDVLQSSLTNKEFSQMDIRREPNGFVHPALLAYNYHPHLILRRVLLCSFISIYVNS